jgi:predicted NBD/HSP70 family sugar kinase
LNDELEFYVGIDLGSKNHRACMINRTGKVLAEIAFDHSGSGMADLIRFLEKTPGVSAARVGIA